MALRSWPSNCACSSSKSDMSSCGDRKEPCRAGGVGGEPKPCHGARAAPRRLASAGAGVRRSRAHGTAHDGHLGKPGHFRGVAVGDLGQELHEVGELPRRGLRTEPQELQL